MAAMILLFDTMANPLKLDFILCFEGGNSVISASSWREGQKLVKKILGPAPRIEQDRRAVSSDRTGRERAAKSGKLFFYH